MPLIYINTAVHLFRIVFNNRNPFLEAFLVRKLATPTSSISFLESGASVKCVLVVCLFSLFYEFFIASVTRLCQKWISTPQVHFLKNCCKGNIMSHKSLTKARNSPHHNTWKWFNNIITKASSDLSMVVQYNRSDILTGWYMVYYIALKQSWKVMIKNILWSTYTI